MIINIYYYFFLLILYLLFYIIVNSSFQFLISISLLQLNFYYNYLNIFVSLLFSDLSKSENLLINQNRLVEQTLLLNCH